LERCGKSCRLRWINYLRPDLKRGSFSAQEERIIIDVHRILGNKWAQIAKHLPGRTDNEVKNFWNSCVKKKLIAQGLDPNTHNLLPASHKTNKNHNNPKPTSVFSVHAQSKDVSMDMSIPFSTLLSIHPNDDTPTIIPIYENQNPNLLWTTQEQNPNTLMEYSTMGSSVPIISSSPSNASGFGILEENCLWSSSGFQQIELNRQDEMLQPQQQEKQASEVETEKADILNMDASYGSSNFGFDFVESPLMACGMYYNTSPTDEFAWD